MARSKPNGRTDGFDIGRLLHPANAFAHPMDVVEDRDLPLTEKRAILASWASDACATEATPELRMGPKAPVRFDDIMDALRSLDKQANAGRYRNPFGRRFRRSGSRNGDSDQGRSLQ